MKPALSILILLAMTSASAAGISLFGGLELPQGFDGRHVIGAGFGLVGILTVLVFFISTTSQKRKLQKNKLAYETQLNAFRQSIHKGSFSR